MWLRVFIICFYCLATSSNSWAQSLADTLQEVNVNSSSIKNTATDIRLKAYSPGQKIISIDSVTRAHYQQQSLAMLLTQQVPVFIRSYGFNGLATLNFRGSSAAQSAVYWNGVPIANAALGISDISVLPVSIFDEINIVYGGAASLWGSGNVGGAIMLGDKPAVFDSVVHVRGNVSAGAGSFGQFLYSGSASITSKRWAASIKLFGQQADNDFIYRDANGTEARNTNAELSSLAGIGNLSYKATKKDVLKFSYWQQAYDRDIPPATFEDYSVKNRQDASNRSLIDWQHNGRQYWYAKAACFKDRLRYDDTTVKLRTDQSVHQYFTEVGWRLLTNTRHNVLLFVPVQYSTIRTIKNELQTQSRVALAGAYSYQDIKRKLFTSLTARAEKIDSTFIFLPGLSASYHATRWLELKVNIQRTYRAPTLNERYYEPGGNASLKPERGWGIDGGYAIHHTTTKGWKLVHEASIYSRTIHDWIIWFGGAVWTPHNVTTVCSQGVELQQSIHIPVGKAIIYARGAWSYTYATTQQSYQPGDGSIGRQIPYTPRYGANANIGITTARLNANLNYTYTGYRYYNTDETGLLPSYNTLNISAQYQLLNKTKYNTSLFAQAYNLLNKQYVVVNARPMPGVYGIGGVTLELK